MGVGEMEDDDRGIVVGNECEVDKQNLSGRLVLMLRAGILVGEVVVVVVVGVMVVKGLGVICFEKRCLSVMEVECLCVGFGLVGVDIFDLGGDFIVEVVEIEMEALKLEVGAVVRLVWDSLNERMYFLWCLSRMSLAGKISNVGGHPFGMVMQDFFRWSSSFWMVVVSKR